MSHAKNKGQEKSAGKKRKTSDFLLPQFQTVCRGKENNLWMEKKSKIEGAWIACPLMPSKRKCHGE